MKRKIQVYIENEWQYIFCNDPNGGIIPTKNSRLALPEKGWHLKCDLAFFKDKFSDYIFRTVVVDEYNRVFSIDESFEIEI